MNILIIGNGFDLVHELPTSYIDFLKISKIFFDEVNDSDNHYYKLFEKLKQNLMEIGLLEDFKRFLNDNLWFNFLLSRLERNVLTNMNWIDFEAEVRKVVFYFENERQQNNNEEAVEFKLSTQDINDYENLIGIVAERERIHPANSYHEYCLCAEYLFGQLRNLTRAFELYCVFLINKMNDDFVRDNKMIELDKQIRQYKAMISEYQAELLTKRHQFRKHVGNEVRNFRNANVKSNSSLDSLNGEIQRIENLKQDCSVKLSELLPQYDEWRTLREVKIDCVLSFNYTNTFFSRYGTLETQYCYIHGAAQLDNKNTNMIFGIDETLGPQEANKNFAFIKFKKYFQRIFYKTGAEYRDWIKNTDTPINVYILGHSLGTTDHEVLREFFNLTNKDFNGNPLMKISIFYHDEKTKVNVIERVIEIIGKNQLIEKVHGSDWSIRFLQQNDLQDGIIMNSK